MRAFRTVMTAAGLLGFAPAMASAQYTPENLLKIRPSQPGVECDTPADPAVVASCKVEPVLNAQKSKIGFALRDGQGKLLRRMIDTNGLSTQREKEPKAMPHLDQWSYYQNGFEVYRENDTDDNEAVDECRWLNAGGTRVGVVKGNKVVAWKRISAEEASKVVVQALVANDPALLETVMATPDDLAALGAPKGMIDQVKAASEKRADDLAALRKGLASWVRGTVWQRFDGTMPHIIPADAGLKGDLALYESAFVFAGPASGQGDPMTMAYLQVPELIKVGECWKLVELPRAIDPKSPPAAIADSGFRSFLFREGNSGPSAPANPKMELALKALADHDQKNTPALNAPKQVVAEYFVDRVRLLNAVSKEAPAEEQLNYLKQIVDCLAQAYQTGVYDDAGPFIDKYIAMGGKIGSFAAFRKALAEYQRDMEEPGANEVAVQKKFVASLEAFVTKFEGSEEAADALLQIASLEEFNGNEDQAKTYYEKLVAKFPASPAGKKAAGAVKRLGLVGKPIELSGQGVDGKPVAAEQFKGKTLLITFWTSGADAVRRDLPDMVKVYEKNRAKGFEILGVNFDNDKETLVSFLKENPLPWAQVYEEGGMDSRLADEFGIISLPTMILVDGTGKVLNRNIRTAAELERYLDKLGAGAAGAAANRDRSGSGVDRAISKARAPR